MGLVRVQAPGAVLAVYDSERPGEPVLLLHGGPGVPDYMQEAVGSLLPGFHAISFDQRGVGASTCQDGRYELAAYLDDIEAVRRHVGPPSWHVIGHSWGGLLAQAYTARHPDRVRSLALCSSALGVAGDWKRTKRTSFRIELRRAGVLGATRFFLYGSLLIIPGRLRRLGMEHVMTETWHNYFPDPGSAPDPDPAWLAGCSADAMARTDRALRREDPQALAGLDRYRGPSMVLYGEHDIYSSDAQRAVRDRLPHAAQVTLERSGHLHWLENRDGFSSALATFLAAAVAAGSIGP